MTTEPVVLVGDQFAFDVAQGLVGRKALVGNIIINFPFPHFLHMTITSSWMQAIGFLALCFVLANPGKCCLGCMGLILVVLFIAICTII